MIKEGNFPNYGLLIFNSQKSMNIIAEGIAYALYG